MMKKTLLYAVTAILLGTVTMVAPLMLLKPSYYASGPGRFLSEGKETYAGEGTLERAVSPSNLSSAGLMLIPSFFLAIGVSLYVKKRMF